MSIAQKFLEGKIPLTKDEIIQKRMDELAQKRLEELRELHPEVNTDEGDE